MSEATAKMLAHDRRIAGSLNGGLMGLDSAICDLATALHSFCGGGAALGDVAIGKGVDECLTETFGLAQIDAIEDEVKSFRGVPQSSAIEMLVGGVHVDGVCYNVSEL